MAKYISMPDGVDLEFDDHIPEHEMWQAADAYANGDTNPFQGMVAETGPKVAIFAGENAKNPPAPNSDRWFTLPDKRKRFEIDDSKAQVLGSPSYFQKGDVYRLEDILSHSDLYSQYPQLRSLPVVIGDSKDEGNKQTYGMYINKSFGYGDSNKITPEEYKALGGSNEFIWLNKADLGESPASYLNTLLHETQHAVGISQEGFDYKGNSKDYWHRPGEASAREVENRATMTPEERKKTIYQLKNNLESIGDW